MRLLPRVWWGLLIDSHHTETARYLHRSITLTRRIHDLFRTNSGLHMAAPGPGWTLVFMLTGPKAVNLIAFLPENRQNIETGPGRR